MMDRVHRPVCLAVLMLLCAPLARSAEGQSAPTMPSLAEILQQAAQMQNQAARQQNQARKQLEDAGVSSPQAGPSRPSRGAKKDSTSDRENPQGYSDVRVTLEGSFDLHVQDADARTVLRQLSAQAKRNIVTSSQVTGMVTADLYSVGFTEALDAVTEAAGLTYQLRDGVVYVYTPAELTLRRQEQPVAVRVFHLAYLRAGTAKDLIEGMLSPKGKAMVTPDEHTNLDALPTPTWEEQRRRNVAEDVLVVSDYEYVLDEVAKVIEKVDVKPEQVLIEATILSATLDDDNALGVDLQGLIGTNFNTFGATSTLTDLTVPAPPAGGVTDFSHWQSRVNTNFTGNLPNDFGAPFTFGIVYDNVGAFVHALESVRDVTVLANPKLLIVNKQRGEVLVGREDGYLTTVVTDTSAIEQVEFLETGTKLIVRPFVGKNDHIRLEIHPEDSTGTVEPAEGTTENSPALPRKTTTQVTTNIIIRDGKTVVIGGLFRDEVTTTRRQVPIIGDIPWAGTLFRSTVDATTRAEVIILITPHLIRDYSQEAVGERMRFMAERYRIGAREGLRWWGRNRLSAEYLKRATQAYSQGEMDKAHWWLDLCLSLQPDLVEAMLLKERMTDQASWADPPQFADTRFLVTRMLMQELGYDAETVLPPQRPLRNKDLRPQVRKAVGAYLHPKRSGAIRKQTRYVAVPRDDSDVPGAVEMKPVNPKNKPAPPKKQRSGMKTRVAKPAPPQQAKPARKIVKPETTSRPAPKTRSVKKAVPNPKPAVKNKTSEPTTQPAKKSEPKKTRGKKPAAKSKPKATTQPAGNARPAVQSRPAPAPESSPAAKSTKSPREPGEPRLAPIQDPPVAPASESDLSSKEREARQEPDFGPQPVESSAADAPQPVPTVRRDEIKTDLPDPIGEPKRKKSDVAPTTETPRLQPGQYQPLEQDRKSSARRYLETGTLSAILKKNGKNE